MKVETWYNTLAARGVDVHNPNHEQEMIQCIIDCMLADPDELERITEELMEEVEGLVMAVLPIVAYNPMAYGHKNLLGNTFIKIVDEARKIFYNEVAPEIEHYRMDAIYHESLVAQSQHEDYLYDESLARND